MKIQTSPLCSQSYKQFKNIFNQNYDLQSGSPHNNPIHQLKALFSYLFDWSGIIQNKSSRIEINSQQFGSQGIQIQMNQTYEGTTIDLKPAPKRQPQQEKVEELKQTGNPLSGQKPEFQNPEGQVEDAKGTSETKNKIAQLWAEMTNLKRGILIGGVVLIIILVVVFTLLIISLSYKPKLKFKQQATLVVPTTNDKIQVYNVEASKKNLLASNKNTSFTMTTITEPATARMLQQGGTQTSIEDPSIATVILEFSQPNTGVNILATSPDDVIVYVNYDELISSYSNPRLLFQAEMMAALRTLQEDVPVAPDDNALAFDDSSSILRSAEGALLKAVAAATSASPADLVLEYSETVAFIQQDDGSLVQETSPKSSRLLRALQSIRGLQQWDGFFGEIAAGYLIPSIAHTQSILSDFFSNGETVIEDPVVAAVLKNSNFAPGVETIIVDDSETETTVASRRLAQTDSPSASPSPAATTKTTTTTSTATATAIATTTNTDLPQSDPEKSASETKTPATNSTKTNKPAAKKKQPKKPSRRQIRPIAPRWNAKNKGKQGSKSKPVNQNSIKQTECFSGRKKVLCEEKFANSKAFALKIKKEDASKPTNTSNSNPTNSNTNTAANASTTNSNTNTAANASTTNSNTTTAANASTTNSASNGNNANAVKRGRRGGRYKIWQKQTTSPAKNPNKNLNTEPAPSTTNSAAAKPTTTTTTTTTTTIIKRPPSVPTTNPVPAKPQTPTTPAATPASPSNTPAATPATKPATETITATISAPQKSSSPAPAAVSVTVTTPSASIVVPVLTVPASPISSTTSTTSEATVNLVPNP